MGGVMGRMDSVRLMAPAAQGHVDYGANELARLRSLPGGNLPRVDSGNAHKKAVIHIGVALLAAPPAVKAGQLLAAGAKQLKSASVLTSRGGGQLVPHAQAGFLSTQPMPPLLRNSITAFWGAGGAIYWGRHGDRVMGREPINAPSASEAAQAQSDAPAPASPADGRRMEIREDIYDAHGNRVGHKEIIKEQSMFGQAYSETVTREQRNGSSFSRSSTHVSVTIERNSLFDKLFRKDSAPSKAMPEASFNWTNAAIGGLGGLAVGTVVGLNPLTFAAGTAWGLYALWNSRH